MRWRFISAIPVALLIVTALSGCLEGAAIEEQFEDADDRTGRTFAGDVSQDWTVNVPDGASILQMSLAFSIAGDFSARLVDPSGQTQNTEVVDGTGKSVEEDWYRETDPTAGTWHVEIEADGSGAYAVGAYFS